MANRTLFQSSVGTRLPAADAGNKAGGFAYALTEKHALAQFAATGCLNHTFYVSASEQLETVLQLTNSVAPEFIARTALFTRQAGSMKDMPALLCAILSVKSPGLLAEVFDRVIDNPRMLRNFVQIMRSGVVGRKSLGTLPKRLVLQWLEKRTDEQLFRGSLGRDPALADIIRMVHPKPWNASRNALFGYLLGKPHSEHDLPELVKQYEKFKRNTNPGRVAVPDVPFQMLTSLQLTKKDWEQIARNASWQMTRMNLNTFHRHGVFDNFEVTRVIANRLKNPALIRKARVFPYQLLTAWKNIGQSMPRIVADALQDAMEVATENVPEISGKVYVFPDVSGSMHCPVTGYRSGGTTTTRCIDVAALVAAAIMRRNPDTEVIPFSDRISQCRLNARDTVITNAEKLARLPSGGTNCSLPLAHLNERRAKGDLVVYVSDNESWIDSSRAWSGRRATETMTQWNIFKKRNRTARMVCIDIQPNATAQAKESADIVNVGGFSDQVFRLMADVAAGRFAAGHFVNQIEQVVI